MKKTYELKYLRPISNESAFTFFGRDVLEPEMEKGKFTLTVDKSDDPELKAYQDVFEKGIDFAKELMAGAADRLKTGEGKTSDAEQFSLHQMEGLGFYLRQAIDGKSQTERAGAALMLMIASYDAARLGIGSAAADNFMRRFQKEKAREGGIKSAETRNAKSDLKYRNEARAMMLALLEKKPDASDEDVYREIEALWKGEKPPGRKVLRGIMNRLKEEGLRRKRNVN
jgi:hypothetical protein